MEICVPSREHVKALYDLVSTLRKQIKNRQDHHVKSVINQIEKLVRCDIVRVVDRALRDNRSIYENWGTYSAAGWPDSNRVSRALVGAEALDEIKRHGNWSMLEGQADEIAADLEGQLGLNPSNWQTVTEAARISGFSKGHISRSATKGVIRSYGTDKQRRIDVNTLAPLRKQADESRL